MSNENENIEKETNYSKWRVYTKGLSSPNNFIDWSWYYLICASLQRRVWLAPEHQPCFPNIYVILVGQPGIGKGLVIREVSDILKHYKLGDIQFDLSKVTDVTQREIFIDMQKQEAERAAEQEHQGKNKHQEIIKPLMIPVAADATTYEALVKAVSESLRRVNYCYTNPKNGNVEPKIYIHSSLCFCLQELSSLLRKRTDDTVNYMLGLYDCPLDYEYVTKTQGKDRIRRGCLNMLAGTTPSFMQSTFDEKLMDEGFSSRTFYIFANKNRHNQFSIPTLSDEQKLAKAGILEHVKKLCCLYGQVETTAETEDFLQRWWDDQEKNKHLRSNKSLKLTAYYSRKNIHVKKLAMALHFGESTEMIIPLSTFKRAIQVLEDEEKRMHLAITLESHNMEAKVAKKLLELLQTGKKNWVEIYTNLFALGDKKMIEQSMSFLAETDQIKSSMECDETTQKKIMYWELK